jgi:hypothetical protein
MNSLVLLSLGITFVMFAPFINRTYHSCHSLSPSFQDPNPLGQAMAAAHSSGISCRALYPYKAAQKDELAFPAGAVITNVIKKDQGRCGV